MKKTIRTLVITITAMMTLISSPVTAKAQLLSVENPAAVQYYNMIPGNVRAHLDMDGVNVLVNTAAMQAVDSNPRVIGVTEVWTTNGVITSENVYVKNGEEKAILHEVGHVIDNYNRTYCYWSSRDDWYAIYVAEINNAVKAGMSSANLYDSSEYFAESFELYVINPVSLATNCPLTYQFMSAAVAMQ